MLFDSLNTDDVYSTQHSCSYLESNDFNNLNINSTCDFHLFYMSARSLCKYCYDIEDYLYSLLFLFTVSLKPGSRNPLYSQEYLSACSFVSFPQTWEGVAMFISDSLNFCIRDDLMCSCEDFECIFIEIQRQHGCNLIISTI